MNRLFGTSLFLMTIVMATTYSPKAKRDFYIEILSLNITAINEKYIKSIIFRVYEKKAIFLEFTLLKNIVEAKLKLNFQVAKKDNRLISLMNIDVNACDLLRRTHNNNLMKLVMREFFRSTNIPQKCPLLANTLYYLKNYTAREEDYPMQTPLMEFQLNYKFFTNNEILAIQIIKGRVRKI